MQTEIFAADSQDSLTNNHDSCGDSDHALDIQPISMECFGLVGGGTAIVVLG